MLVSSSRSSSKEGSKDAPPSTTSTNTPAASSGTHNLVSAEGVDPVNEREIYTGSSDSKDLIGGAHGGYVAWLMEGQMPVDFKEYLSDESNDTSYTMYNYRA